MKVLIPSYMRCGRVSTIEYALTISDEIVISTQTEDDFEAYSDEYGGVARVVYRAASSAAGNRNTLLETVGDGERALMLDDDTPSLKICFGEKSNMVRDATRGDIDGFFDAMEREGVRLGGAYPVDNPYFAFRREAISRNAMLIGAAMMFVGGGLRFNERYCACEDYELSLRLIAGGETILRFNRLLCTTSGDSMADGLSGKTSGGMAGHYARGEHAEAIRRLVSEYWPIAKLGKNGTSLQIDRRYV